MMDAADAPHMTKRSRGCIVVVWAACAATMFAGAASARLEPDPVTQAAAIRADVTTRYASAHGLVVTEASSTAVVGSLALWSSDGTSVREVPTVRGVYYALCPIRATCPFPSRKRARPVAEFAPRQAALELALRSFSETTADLVVVSLPTRRWVLLVLERSELAAIPAAASMDAHSDLRVETTRATREAVDGLTLRHLYTPFALGIGSDGTETLAAVQLTP